jgi:hypothetical protein
MKVLSYDISILESWFRPQVFSLLLGSFISFGFKLWAHFYLDYCRRIYMELKCSKINRIYKSLELFE